MIIMIIIIIEIAKWILLHKCFCKSMKFIVFYVYDWNLFKQFLKDIETDTLSK